MVFGAKFVLPGQDVTSLNWSPEEQKKSISVRPIAKTNHLSMSVLRLNGQEKPHYHDRHDLIVTVAKGVGAINFKDRRVELMPGDMVVIPRGTYHWAESIGPKAAEFYVVFTPPFDPSDRRFVDHSHRKN